jgi:hypothetical protein
LKPFPNLRDLLLRYLKLKANPEYLGNATGYPGVFQGNPSPYPWKPTPAATGAGFHGYGVWVYSNPRVLKPIQV